MGATAAAKPAELNPRQARFVEEYIANGGNGTQAAIKAGYSARTAGEQAPRLLADVRIATAVAAGRARATERAEVSVDRIVRELAIIGFSDVRHFELDGDGKLVLREGAPDEAWRAVSSVDYEVTTRPSGDVQRKAKIRLWNKGEALAMLGKHTGGFSERHEHTGQVNLVVSPEDAAL